MKGKKVKKIKENNKKNKRSKKINFILIMGLIIIIALISIIVWICIKNKNEEKMTEERYKNSSYFDDYIDKVNEFNEIFENIDFMNMEPSEEDPDEEWRCTTLNEEEISGYLDSYNELYGITTSNFVNLITRVYKDGRESKRIVLCKPLNCNITPISRDLFEYQEEDNKYLYVGEDGNSIKYELTEVDGKLKSTAPIVYCPVYSDIEG